MARHGSKIGSTLIQKIGLNSLNSKQSNDKLRKTSLEQSLEETAEQQAVEEEQNRNQMLPSTHHQLNRISTNGNDGSSTRNSYPNLNSSDHQSNLTLFSRLMMISGASLICLTLFISVFCYFRLKTKQLLIENNENNGLNNHGSSIDNTIDSKQSLNNPSQCSLSSISATLLRQQSTLENGTINSLFTNNLNNLNNLNPDHSSFIIAGLTSHALDYDSCTAGNLTIYSNQPSTLNYSESNQNKL